MSAPQKNFNNYTSPYARTIQQYPSQSEDYISLQCEPPHRYSRNGLSHTSTPAKHVNNMVDYNDEYKRPNNSFYVNPGQRGARNGGYGPIRHNNTNYRGGNDFRQQPRHQKFRKQQHPQEHCGKEFSFSSYFHFSMLQDPWKELLERECALRKSKIDLECNESEDSEAPEDENTESGNSDDEDEANVTVETTLED